jgi:hypothetical protein
MSIFRHVAGSVQAKHIQNALGPKVQANQSGLAAWELLYEESNDYDPMSRISLVLAGDRPVGWIALDSLDSTTNDVSVSVAAKPIPADRMVSGDTPVLEVVKLFSNDSSPFYFVLQESQITGTIDYEDLFGSPFKLCLFALTLELETAALDLALQTPAASWSALSEGRHKEALRVYTQRYSREPDTEKLPFDHLLGCTTFIDKGTILKKRKLITDGSSDIESVFRKANRVRNSCAHTDPEKEFSRLVLERAALQGFITKTEEMIAAIRRQLQTSRR